MPDEQQPATRADLQALEARMDARFASLQEAMRDMQTEILGGLERFARGRAIQLPNDEGVALPCVGQGFGKAAPHSPCHGKHVYIQPSPAH